jgi:beta-N-acetylglucosaminidase
MNTNANNSLFGSNNNNNNQSLFGQQPQQQQQLNNNNNNTFFQSNNQMNNNNNNSNNNTFNYVYQPVNINHDKETWKFMSFTANQNYSIYSFEEIRKQDYILNSQGRT